MSDVRDFSNRIVIAFKPPILDAINTPIMSVMSIAGIKYKRYELISGIGDSNLEL